MTRDAFGRLLASPESLTFEQRLAVLRELAGWLQSQQDRPERVWLGAGVMAVILSDADLLGVLKLRPAKGSKRTVKALLAQEKRDAEVLRGEAKASRWTVARIRRRGARKGR